MGYRGRDKFQKFKKVINIIVLVTKSLPSKLRKNLFVLFRKTSGRLGFVIRYIVLKSIASNIGDNVAIYPNVFLLNPEKISIGNNVSINPMCYIECLGGLKIGNDVSIAHMATIMTTSHEYKDPAVPIKDQGVLTKQVNISDYVWIGAKATILYGCDIGEGSIIGANALVTKNITHNSIAVSTRANILKERVG